MRHLLFDQTVPTTDLACKAALLFKTTAFRQADLVRRYVDPLNVLGIAPADLVAFTLDYNEHGKAPASFIKAYLARLLPALDGLGISVLYVADAAYFKVLTRKSRADPSFGYALDCQIKGFEHMKVVLGLNYQQLIFNPALSARLDTSLGTLASVLQGTYVPVGEGIIHGATYPTETAAIARALDALHQHPCLTCDIEAYSLRFEQAGIGTVAFAWNQHEGIAFGCDTRPRGSDGSLPGERVQNSEVRALLKNFFTRYQGKLVFHNAAYDVKLFIFSLFMENLLDTEGLLAGLEVMTRNFDDTKIIAYLATNSCSGNVLGLKPLAQEFAGDWAVEVSDISTVPFDDLLRYNLVDALSTHYVRDKYLPVMEADNQRDIYDTLMLPSQKMLLQTELSGMPLNPAKVALARDRLLTISQGHLNVLERSPLIREVTRLLRQAECDKANAKLKVKQHPLSKFDDLVFNPNSGLQLQRLLYEVMNLPVIDKTDTGLPATGADTLDKLIHHTTDAGAIAVIEALIGYGKASKILSTFIPVFEQGIDKGDGMRWVHGSFNIGGAVSGRLSSSDPNLQNLPAGSEYGQQIKDCFEPPQGWLMVGADFNSLEDMVSALTTKDPNKLAVYERGFDGHSLRAAYYFRDECPEIDLQDPVSVNSIEKTYPRLRQASKQPTFLLTYGGTYYGLMKNLGWPKPRAREIEASYHALYQVSDAYVQRRLKQASQDGYTDVAFGLRIRTPLLKQVLFNAPKMPYEAKAEGRTAGNGMGQSYCLLNNRAAVAFMSKVWDSPYRLDIKPIGLIHDAIYLLVRNDVAIVEWVNRELIEAMQWQALPELRHETVKLGANLDIFWPSWAEKVTLPNGASAAQIEALCRSHKEALTEPGQGQISQARCPAPLPLTSSLPELINE